MIFQARSEEAQLAPARVGDVRHGPTHRAAAVPAASDPLHGVPEHRSPGDRGVPPVVAEGAAVQAEDRRPVGYRAR